MLLHLLLTSSKIRSLIYIGEFDNFSSCHMNQKLQFIHVCNVVVYIVFSVHLYKKIKENYI